MGAEFTRAFPGAEITLIRGGGGDFIVTVDGREIWNKKQTHDGEFPDEQALVGSVKG